MKKKFLLMSFILLTLIAFYGQAWAALSTEDSSYLGFWSTGAPAGDAIETGVVNLLISMNPGDTSTYYGNTVTRSDNTFTDLGAAVFSSKNNSGSWSQIDVTDIDYILAKYDGPNYGSEIWYVGDLSGDIDLPSALGGNNNDQYAISHYTLFTAVPLPSSFLFFGSGLLGLASFSRRKR